MYQFDETEHAIAAQDFLSRMRDETDYVGDYRPPATTTTTATVLETFDSHLERATVLRIYTAQHLATDLVDAVLTVSDGATVLETRGYWRDETGAIVDERAVVVEVVTTTDHERETITRYADSIGAKYGETAILLTVGLVQSEMLYCS